MDADEILNRIRATTWDEEHDRETFSMSRPAALELLRTRLSPEPDLAAAVRLLEEALPFIGWSGSYEELKARIDQFLAARKEAPK